MHSADFGARKSGFEMSDLHNRSQTSARRGDYVWQYEYYDDEEPVSFEGLRAHRYSIVIGFWVGLAVFVIFMFFVLTLLTKTGAPHQESTDSAEKRHRPGSCLVDVDAPQNESDKAFSRPLLPVARSYFNFHINEDERKGAEVNGKEVQTAAAAGNRGRPEAVAAGEVMAAATVAVDEEVLEEEEEEALKGLMEAGAADRAFLSHFNIPNFVNLDHSSSLGEDDLLYEPSSVLERRLPSHD